MKKTSVLILITLILASYAVSCGGSEAVSPAADVTAEITPAETETTALNEPQCEVPDDIDLGGRAVPVLNFDYRLASNFTNFLVSAEEQNGEILNDAVYAANSQLMEEMNFTFDFIDNGGDDTGKLTAAVNAGDDIYDMVYGTQFQVSALVTKGMLANLNAAEGGYVDIKKPWWYSGYISEAAVDDKHTYYLAGDLSPDIMRMSSMMLLNMNLLEDIGGDIGSIYDTVLAGNWTYDEMFALSSQLYFDVDGDSQRTDADTYGFASYTRSDVDHFAVAAGVRGVSRDDEGMPYITFNNEKTVKFVERLVDYIWNSEGSYYVEGAPTFDMLKDKRVLLLNEKFFRLDALRDSEVDYTVIPLPKLDSSIDKYSSLAHDISLVICVPSISANVIDTTAVLEKMSYLYYKNVMPQYYEVILKVKYRRDSSEASMRILDLIHDGLTTDFSYFYNNSFGGMYWSLRDLIGVSKSKDFASLYAKNESKYQTGLDNLIEALQGNE